ncbi:hypothetical protein ACSZNL_02615 [Aeromonas jandaei]|uniref:hypothetical protein n=1 Tax=Aeromonas jandaei TaxID=650 RepID=UPI003EC85D97
MSDHWDDNFNQEKAPPDFLVEREDVVGEGALADQLAKLADLYISKLQGNRMAGLAHLGWPRLAFVTVHCHSLDW